MPPAGRGGDSESRLPEGEFGSASHSQFSENAMEVFFDAANRKGEFVCDLFVRFRLPHQVN